MNLEIERRTIASFDGTPLGVQAVGPRDAPALLLANGLGATLLAHRHVLRHFGSAFRVVSWDYRGLHASGRPVGGYASLDVEHHAKDALAVADVLELREFHAFAWSMGVQVMLELYRAAPDRFLTLVLHNGVSGLPWKTLGTNLDQALAFGQKIDFLVERFVQKVVDWDGFVRMASRAGFLHHDVDRETFYEVAQGFKSIDMHVYFEIMRRLGRHDATDVLSRIACPTLIVQGKRDPFTPGSAAERMAQMIPGARLVMIPDGTHYAAFETPDEINRHLEAFWRIAGVEVQR
jgi:pimeloyl-ACP methyl ester carboxylesterase